MQGLPLFASRRNISLHVLAIAVPFVLLLTILSQNVFARNTYVITEGDQVIVHKTYAKDPADALQEAGFNVEAYEYHTVESDDHVLDVTVIRDDVAVLINCGEKIYVAVEDDTVGDLLERIGMPSDEEYEVSCDLDTKVVDGMTITVNSLSTRKREIVDPNEPIINNGVAVFPSGEVISCYELEDE